MARKKKIEETATVTTSSGAHMIRVTCNHCGEIGRLVFRHSPVEAGGSRCRGCNKFDDFSADYEKDGKKLALITVLSKENMKVRLVVEGGQSEKLQEFFETQKLEHWEFSNILIEAGLLQGTKFVPRFNEDSAQQDKHERFIAAKLKSFVKKQI